MEIISFIIIRKEFIFLFRMGGWNSLLFGLRFRRI